MARQKRDTDLGRLAGAWLERAALVGALFTADLPGRGWASITPGMRADRGSNTVPRLLEGAMLGELLGVPQPVTWSKPTRPAVRLLEALRSVDVASACKRIREDARRMINTKRLPNGGPSLTITRQVRLHVPMSIGTYNDTINRGRIAGWIGRGVHGQDPSMLAVSYVAPADIEWLWPFEDRDPPEEGWSAELIDSAAGQELVLFGEWLRKSKRYTAELRIPKPDDVYVIGDDSGVEPLVDLPNLPDPVPHDEVTPDDEEDSEPPNHDEGDETHEAPIRELVTPNRMRQLDDRMLRRLGETVLAVARTGPAGWQRLQKVARDLRRALGRH
jgi:hypothetical protein